MPLLNVTDELLEKLMTQVVPLVARATGWDLSGVSRTCRVVPKDQGYEEIVLGRLRGAGVDPGEVLPAGLLGRFVERLVEDNVLAAYQPATREILVLRENVDDSNLDGLCLVLAHELVHAAQHTFHPELFARLDDIVRQAFAQFSRADEEGGDFEAVRALAEETKPVMTLLESHAAYVQRSLAESHYPHGYIESHASLATLLVRFLGRAKLAQYSEAWPQVATAMAAGKLDELYGRL